MPSHMGALVTGQPESHLEEFFLWAAIKYLDPAVNFTMQVPVTTSYGNFRLDGVLTRGQHRVAVELDGATYHDAVNDVLRDAAILRAGTVTTIYRIPARHLFKAREQCLWLLAHMVPWCVSERARAVLKTQMRAAGAPDPDSAMWTCAYHSGVDYNPPAEEAADERQEPEEAWHYVVIERHDLANPRIRIALNLFEDFSTLGLRALRPLFEKAVLL